MGRTTSITVTSGAATLWEATYGYDTVGNRTWSKYGTQGDAYAYDATYQVTGVKYGSATPESGYAAITDAQGSSTWTYDPAGNRTNQTVTGTVPGVDPAATSYTANDINSYAAVTEDGTPVNSDTLALSRAGLAHSPRADLSAFGDWSYTNDVYGNIIQAANGTQTVRFYFDGANKRVGKEIDTDGPIWWLHDVIHLVEEYDSVTSQTAEYIYEPGIDRPLAKIEGGVTKFFHQDVLGNSDTLLLSRAGVVALTNGGGDLVEEYRYDIWGNSEALDQNGDPIQGTPESIFLFTARQWDPEPGIYYYQARSYSQTLGRFMQQDPIGFGGGDLNVMRYVWNMSLRWTDPSGKGVLDDIIDWVNGVIGATGPGTVGGTAEAAIKIGTIAACQAAKRAYQDCIADPMNCCDEEEAHMNAVCGGASDAALLPSGPIPSRNGTE